MFAKRNIKEGGKTNEQNKQNINYVVYDAVGNRNSISTGKTCRW